MKKIPSRDINGKCQGECRDRVLEGEVERQIAIDTSKIQYSSPSERSPEWTARRSEPPGVMGGRV